MRSDILLHPVRLRIVLALAGRPMTAGELRTQLPDVAQASLYRHLRTLVDAGLLDVVDERPAPGGVERTYGVVEGAVAAAGRDVTAGDPAPTVEDHLRWFATFVGALVGDLSAHLESAVAEDRPIDPVADGISYRQAALWLDDAELADLVTELRAVIEPRLALDPAPGRRRRLLSTILMPDARTPPA